MKQSPIDKTVVRKRYQSVDQWMNHKSTTPISMYSLASLYQERTVKIPSFTASFLQVVKNREIVKTHNAFYAADYKKSMAKYREAYHKWVRDMDAWRQGRYSHVVRSGATSKNRKASSEYSRTVARPTKPKRPSRVPRTVVRDTKRPQIWTPLPYTHTRVLSALGWEGWLKKYRISSVSPYPTFKAYDAYGPNQWTEFTLGDMKSPRSLAECIAEAKNIAKTKLLMKLKDSKFNGIQAYAEAGQLQQLVGTHTNKIANALMTLRRGNLRAAAEIFGLQVSKRAHTRYSKAMSKATHPDHISNVLANGVLQVQYGIRPLLSDVIGAAELLAQKVSREVANKVTVKHDFVYDFKGTYNGNGGTCNIATTGKCSRHITVRYGVTYGKGNEVVHTVAQLGITNPLLIAWELTPWSFVIDWFIPIGNYISSLDATLGLEFKEGYVSTKSMTVDHYDCTLTPRNMVSYDIGHATKHSDSTQFTREVLTSFPTASLPTFKNPLSWEHALNGVALLVGLKNKLIKSTFH